ncbi:MAG: YbhN family protein [Candidatus Nanopelagicales bacterium]|nr:YbhN family protein [Candidatus Nanopelagicales bacterium]MDZ4248736.1 YbhN family protein [Candidatus Nanopelagicales bacterium]
MPPENVVPDGVKTRHSRRRFVITALVGVIVVVAVFALLLPQASSYQEALKELADMPVVWILAVVVAGLANIAVYPFTVLVAIPRLGYWRGFSERQAGFLVSNAIPGGGAIAVGTQYSMLSRYGVPSALSAAAVSADAVWTYLLTLGMPAVAVTLLVVEGRSTAGMATIAIIGLAVVLVSVILIVIVLRSESGARRVGRLAERLIGPVFHRLHRETPDFVGSLVEFRENAHGLVAQKWKQLTVTNVAAQIMPLFVLFFALVGLDAVGEQLSIIEIFAAYSVALLLVSIPVTPGGLGTVDAALIGLLVAFGAPGSVAVAADLLWRLIWFLPQIIAGLSAMAAYLISRRRPVPESKLWRGGETAPAADY